MKLKGAAVIFHNFEYTNSSLDTYHIDQIYFLPPNV